ATLRRSGDLQIAERCAALVALRVHLPVPPDLEVEPFRQRVDHGDTDAVQTARDFVAVVVELAARVKHREYDFGRGLAARVPVDGNATAVVDDGDRVVDVNRDIHLIAVPGERFVDRVVDDFVHEVMQTRRTGRPDVHGWAFPDRLKAFQNLDLVRAVVLDR